MVVKRLALLALLVCSAAGLQRTVRAEEASLRNTEDAMSARIDQLDLRINQLEAENAALRRQSGGYVSGGEGCGCGDDYGCAPAGCCDDCCAGCCGPGCSCGFYGGAELFWAQPRWRGFDVLTLTTAPPGPIAAISHTQGFDYDYDPTARFFVGYTGCNGLGVRSSWWEHDDDANTIELTNPALGLLRTPLGVFVAAGNTLVAPSRSSCKPGTSRPRAASKPAAATSLPAWACATPNPGSTRATRN